MAIHFDLGIPCEGHAPVLPSTVVLHTDVKRIRVIDDFGASECVLVCALVVDVGTVKRQIVGFTPTFAGAGTCNKRKKER